MGLDITCTYTCIHWMHTYVYNLTLHCYNFKYPRCDSFCYAFHHLAFPFRIHKSLRISIQTFGKILTKPRGVSPWFRYVHSLQNVYLTHYLLFCLYWFFHTAKTRKIISTPLFWLCISTIRSIMASLIWQIQSDITLRT